jgi:hypothetical protein
MVRAVPLTTFAACPRVHPPGPFPCIQAPEQSCRPTGPTGPSGSASGGGGGNGPKMGPAPRPPLVPCHIEDAVLGALELKFKVGLEGEISKVKVGFSIYKNPSSGEQGTEMGLSLGLAGVQVDRPTNPGGSITGGAEPPQVKVSFVGFEKNLSTGEKASFKPAGNLLRIGGALGVGLELSFNPDKFSEISRANAACRAQGGS